MKTQDFGVVVNCMSSDLFLFSFIALLIIFFLFQASEVLFRKLIEKKAIKDWLVKIDFVNGNVLDYFKHLAQAIAKYRSNDV
jgi:hypothetical protein